MKKFSKNNHRIFYALVILLSTVHFLFPQNKKEIERQSQQMRLEVQEFKEKYQKEKQFFDRYKGQKEKLIAQKKSEKKEIESALSQLNRKLSQVKYQSANFEKRIAANEEISREYLDLLLKIVGDLREEILVGIPFEKERRAAILTSIILDIENGNSSSIEVLNRLIAFFDAEDVYSYDSQVFPATIKLKGKNLNANVLRVGRVFFAIDTMGDVYLYRYQNANYVIDETPVSVQDKIEIQKAIRIVQGRRAPEIVKLPIAAKRIAKGEKR